MANHAGGLLYMLSIRNLHTYKYTWGIAFISLISDNLKDRGSSCSLNRFFLKFFPCSVPGIEPEAWFSPDTIGGSCKSVVPKCSSQLACLTSSSPAQGNTGTIMFLTY